MSQNQIHPIQAEILCDLLFKTGLKFSELNRKKISSDQFSFHLNRLLDLDYIDKDADGYYRLTTIGKEYANRFDTQNPLIERQAKVSVLVVCLKNQGRKTLYLVQQRLKQPYFGYYGFITGKVRWGETVLAAAARELKEETNLTAAIKLVGLKHKTDYSKEGGLLEDKYFLVCRATNPTGKLLANFEGGKNTWLSENDINILRPTFDGFKESIAMIKKKTLSFSEVKYFVSGY